MTYIVVMAGTHTTTNTPARKAHTMTRTQFATMLTTEWANLRDDAGYGRFTGAGVTQQAEHVAAVVFDADMDHDQTVMFVAGFMATSLNSNPFDAADYVVDMLGVSA